MLDRDKRIIEYLKSRIEKYENGNKKTMHYEKSIMEMEDYKLNVLVLNFYKTKGEV
tara:strand:+ start:2632 stop:2799 length:168 start_codon:yes stop_codon:yes gene_type:complete